MIAKPLHRIDHADIEALLVNKVIEQTTLEYKRDLPVGDDGRREIAYDLASLANTRGGDLIFGIEAERDATGKCTGAPGAIVGVPAPNLDDLKLRLLQTVENCAKPRIAGIDFATVGNFKHGPVVLARVPQSWNGPHMMHYEKSQRFFARTTAGRYLMDVDQIRAAVLASASLPDQLDAFRRERVARIIANDGSHSLGPGAVMLFHVVPLASMSRAPRVDLAELKKLQMPLMSLVGGGNLRVNFDGYLLPNLNSAGAGIGYVQAFRSGVVESVTSRLADGASPRIGGIWFEKVLVESIRATLQGLVAIGVSPPFYVGITLARVRNARIGTSDHDSVGPIDREILFLPEIQIDQGVLSVQQTAAALRPALDVAWQAAGAEGSCNFDDSGKWTVR